MIKKPEEIQNQQIYMERIILAIQHFQKNFLGGMKLGKTSERNQLLLNLLEILKNDLEDINFDLLSPLTKIRFKSLYKSVTFHINDLQHIEELHSTNDSSLYIDSAVNVILTEIEKLEESVKYDVKAGFMPKPKDVIRPYVSDADKNDDFQILHNERRAKLINVVLLLLLLGIGVITFVGIVENDYSLVRASSKILVVILCLLIASDLLDVLNYIRRIQSNETKS